MATIIPGPNTTPSETPAPGLPTAAVDGKFAIGLVGLWIVLAMLASNNTTKDFAKTMAITAAVAGSFVFLPDAVTALGLRSKGG